MQKGPRNCDFSIASTWEFACKEIYYIYLLACKFPGPGDPRFSVSWPFSFCFKIVENRFFSFVKKRHARIKIVICALLNVRFYRFIACSFEFDQIADSVLTPVTETLTPEARFVAAKLHAILNSIYFFKSLEFRKSHFIFTPRAR